MTQVVSFGRFGLNESARVLSLDGKPLAIQPLVFDFLAYLVQAGGRAVSKDELLDALWPGVTVTEASLQRVASLARATLRGGGLDAALQSVPRFGYRFQCDETAAESPDPLARAHAAAGARRWAEAAAAFAEADARAPLAAPALGTWMLAVECCGRPFDAIPIAMRAVAAFAAAGNRLAAASPAIWLARTHGQRGDKAAARGWHKRAGELIDGVESRQLGLWLCCGSMAAASDGDPQRALEIAEQACALARAIEDPVVEAMALVNRGFFRLCLGQAAEGIADQDLAAALALSSDLDPVQGMVLYCTILWACRNFADWSRATQWQEAFERWCVDAGIAHFTGACRLHRAEVLAVHGTLPEAEALLQSALEHIQCESPWEKGDAWRVLGDIHVAAGRLDDAERAYQEAYAAGWDPQPGLAMLQLQRGDGEGAWRGLERALAGVGWVAIQRRGLILASMARVAVATGRLDRAEAIIAELEAQPQRWPMPAIRALTAEAKADIYRARGEVAPALAALQNAARLWAEVDAATAVADVRLRLARLMMGEDDTGAELELQAVEAIATRLQSARLRDRVAELRQVVRQKASPVAGQANGARLLHLARVSRVS